VQSKLYNTETTELEQELVSITSYHTELSTQ